MLNALFIIPFLLLLNSVYVVLSQVFNNSELFLGKSVMCMTALVTETWSIFR